MNDNNQIIIVNDPSIISSRWKACAQLEESQIDDPPSPQGILSHSELVRLKKTAEKKKMAARKTKLSIMLVLIVGAILLGLIVYISYSIIKEAKVMRTVPSQPQQQTGKIHVGGQPEQPKYTAASHSTVAPSSQGASPGSDKKPLPFTPRSDRVTETVPIEVPVTAGNPQEHRPVSEHSHSPLTFPFPTLGMPQPNITFNTTQVGHFNEYYQYEKAMDELFKPYNVPLTVIQDTNCELQRYGDVGDGGYLLCRNLMGQSEALINLGVQGRDLFGCAVSTEFRIPNYQYDCTNAQAPICNSNKHLNSFSSACLSAQTENANNVVFYSLADMVRSRNLTGRHLSMKIDVEGAEWPGLRTFPIAGLQMVDQLVLEIHLRGGSMGHPQVYGNLDTLRSLAKEFVSVSLHMNNYACVNRDEIQKKTRFYPSFAIEVTLVNRRLITINSPTRSYKLSPKDHPNRGGGDCQLSDQQPPQ